MTTDQHPDVHRGLAPGRPEARPAIATAPGIAWLLVALIGVVGFVALTAIVASGVTVPFDEPLLALARSLDGWAVGWRILSESANLPLVVIGLGLVVWLAATKRRREALIVFLMLAAVTAGSEGVKELVARPRPSGTDPAIPGVVYSFPSGHVLEALTILGIITVRTWRGPWPRPARLGLAIVVVAWVLAVGVARVALNSHYPTDVLAGLLGGSAALGIYGWLTRPQRIAAREPAAAGRGPALLHGPEGA